METEWTIEQQVNSNYMRGFRLSILAHLMVRLNVDATNGLLVSSHLNIEASPATETTVDHSRSICIEEAPEIMALYPYVRRYTNFSIICSCGLRFPTGNAGGWWTGKSRVYFSPRYAQILTDYMVYKQETLDTIKDHVLHAEVHQAANGLFLLREI